ncbi:MAG: penicillin acylase family protein [bacterium]|nr:penicillin acylase family protein [bacterium]
MNTFIKLLLFFLILIIGFAGLAFYWTFYKPLPDYEATIEQKALTKDVTIHWDEYGVPHLFADNESDLYYGFGYVHAQDRLWQMTISQLAAEGRFAEFFGPDLIEFDKYQRTLGIWEVAGRILEEEITQKELQILQAYSDGVNAYIRQNNNKLPVQFALAEMQPLEWTPRHSIAIVRLMGWELNLSWWSEVTYNYLKNKLPADTFEELLLSWDASSPTTLDDTESIGLSTAALLPMLEMEFKKRELLEIEGSHVGSNAWVVDGSRTPTGYPMLAGDPHLGLDMPGKWYEVHLNLSGKNVSGVTVAGIPGVVLGQNDQMAWSFTNIMADDTDFFLEIADDEDRGRYVVDSTYAGQVAYAPFEIVREVIKVKGQEAALYEYRKTKHGPVITDMYPNQALINDQLIAMQWTGHQLSNELRTMYEINWAEDFQDFKDALSHFGVPGQNFMYGDRAGNIAMFSTARLPIRTGNKVTLRRGWVPEDDWQGFIPIEEMPHIINPEKGWIANANNKITTENYPHYIATFWEPPSRIERITTTLAPDTMVTVDDMIALQNDSYSSFAATLTPVILEIIKSQSEYDFSLPVSYLENWDFQYSESSTAASIFDVFFLKFTENTLKDEFGEAAYQNFVVHELIPVRTMTALIQDSSALFDDVTTPQIESRKDMILQSMQDAILFLSDSLGSEPFEWRWEQLHTITFEPPLFGMAADDPNAPKALSMIVDNVLSKGPFSVEGHGMSVNNGQYKWDSPFEMTLGASVRRIVDLSDLSATRSVLPTGQSGNPLSDHYGDQTSMWLNKQYRIFEQNEGVAEKRTTRTMILKASQSN